MIQRAFGRRLDGRNSSQAIPAERDATSMRILVVGPVLDTGGIARFIKALLEANVGYRLDLFNTARPAKANTARGAVGYHALFAAGPSWAVRNAAITAWNLMRFPWSVVRSKARVVHIATSGHWSFWESALYNVMAKLLGQQIVFHYLSDFQKFYDPASAREKRLIQTVLRSADRVVVLSEGVRQAVSTFLDPQKVLVLPSSVDVHLLPTGTQHETRNTHYTTVLFMGGNYGIRKGVQDLVRVIPAVLAEFPRTEFVLCGGGDVERAWRALAESDQAHVRYLGLVDEATKLQLLASAGLYVLPSYSEGMPYGIMEAMACGLPVIATTVGCIPEVVTPEENGLLIQPGDMDGLASSILRLMREPETSSHMSNVNREKAARLFSATRTFEVLRQTYDALTKVRV